MGTDPKKRFQYKELQRKQDRLDLSRNHVSGDVLQRRNSIFTGIDWDEVEVFEQGGASVDCGCYQAFLSLNKSG
jgi:hypothetical protein